MFQFDQDKKDKLRDFLRNIYGRLQLFLVLCAWDRSYRREIIVTALAFLLVNYSILDMDSPYDHIALLIEIVIIWMQLGNDYSILPREYRPSQNGVRFTFKTVRNITVDNETVPFSKIGPPATLEKLKLYNPFKGKPFDHDTALCSDRLDDMLMTRGALPYEVTDTKKDYISSIHQIRYLAIRVANKKQHTTNGKKLALNTDSLSLLVGDSIPVCKTSYFEALLTAEAFRSRIYRRNLRGVDELNTDMTQYFPAVPVDEKGTRHIRLVEDYYKYSAGHIGATSLLITENMKILMMFQGGNKAIDAKKVTLGGSGSTDFDDLNKVPGQDLRDVLCYRMAMETAEEAQLMSHLDTIYGNTMMTGFFHWMDRTAKPEFVGLTKAGDLNVSKLYAVDGDEVSRAEELPIEIKKLSDFKKIFKYVEDNGLKVSLSSLMALHRMTVIADYNKKGATKKQKKIYKKTHDFLFGAGKE